MSAPVACISAASFLTPDDLVPSTWLAHAPFAAWLVDAARPGLFVELGTHEGFSFFAVAQAVKTLGLPTACYAIDTWEGDEYTGRYGEEVFRAVAEKTARSYHAFARLLRGTFDATVDQFGDGTIDLLHLDGRHSYEHVRHDLDRWSPKLSSRGLVLLHDIQVREHGFGVWRLWQELAPRHPSFAFHHGNGLGVLAVGPDVPAAVRPLFAADEAGARHIRTAYATLGDAIVVREALRRTAAARAHPVAPAPRSLVQRATRLAARLLRSPDAAEIAASPLFDAGWYLATYRDVAAAGGDPARHYLEHGAAEGRDPGPGFSTRGYLADNPDVAGSGVNPLLHYLRHGQAEGRQAPRR